MSDPTNPAPADGPSTGSADEPVGAPPKRAPAEAAPATSAPRTADPAKSASKTTAPPTPMPTATPMPKPTQMPTPTPMPKQSPTNAAPTPTAAATATTPSTQPDNGPKPAGGPGQPAGTASSDGAPANGGPEAKKANSRRRPWFTVGAVAAALVVLVALGYFAGLGPMSRLSTTRTITAPAKIGGLDRITDTKTRDRLQLNETRDVLSRINDGKKATVEAYGSPGGDRILVVVALRGKLDIDKTVKDSGVTPEQIKKVGHSTCVTSGKNNVTRCYRGSNTLTVIAQDASEKMDVNAVGPITDEAFDVMK
jgi:hypothetical protein